MNAGHVIIFVIIEVILFALYAYIIYSLAMERGRAATPLGLVMPHLCITFGITAILVVVTACSWFLLFLI